MKLLAYEISVDSPLQRPAAVRALKEEHPEPLLVLDTCQRLEVYGLAYSGHDSVRVSQQWMDSQAFERLARIAAGLESRILGELEVLGQVRQAYKTFHRPETRGSDLDRLFQEALSLARKARKESGIDQNLTSLSGIAARELLNRATEGNPLAVVGTGSLSSSAARYLGKRGTSPVRVTSRCPTNAMTLAMEVGGFGSGLDNMTSLFENVAGILTATAAPHPVIYPQHLAGTAEHVVIIDLSEPPDCDESVQHLDHVEYFSLVDIEQKAKLNTEDRAARAEVAARIIREGALLWAQKR